MVLLRQLSQTLISIVLIASVAPAGSVRRYATTANIWHVAPVGADATGCGSAAAPCRTIQYAVNAAASGDTILVAAGVYTYAASTDVCTATHGTTGVVCIVDKQLNILGGFSPGNWTTPSPANHTIIDGGGAVRGVYIRATLGTASAGLRLEDVTIKNGLARGIPGRAGRDAMDAYGGGLFFDNQLGSVGPLDHDLLSLRHVAFDNNIAQGETVTAAAGGRGFGGGMALVMLSPQNTLDHVTFDGNQAIGGDGAETGGYAAGGGLFVDRVKIDAGTHITFTNNIARAGDTAGSGFDQVSGARADAYGGGAAILIGSSIQLQYVTAIGNTVIGGSASTYAGAALGGAFKVQDATLALRDGTLRQNIARGGSAANGWFAGGGALEAVDSTAIVDRSTIISNTVVASAGVTNGRGLACGGGVMAWRGFSPMLLDMNNAVVADNVVDQGSGSAVAPTGGGGGLCLAGAIAYLAHLTLARNRLYVEQPGLQGVAMLLRDATYDDKSNATLSYSIIADHEGGSSYAAIHVQPGHKVTLNRGLYASNAKNDNSDGLPASSGIYSGTATMLIAASAGFVAPGAPGFDYHLAAGSPARDQASGSWVLDDIDGDARPIGLAADIGADERRNPVVAFLPLVMRN